MIPSITRRHILSLTLFTLAVAGTPAMAQDAWPTRPIRLVLPFSAGGPADTVSRLIAQALNKQLGQVVIVDNKPGAGGIIGSDAVAKSAPDGYTLLIAGNGAIANPLLRTKMPYADADLVPVVTTHTSPSVMVTSVSSGFSNLKELQAYGKRKGGLMFGTAGAGSTGHFIGEMVRSVLGVPVTLVHYKSGSETVNALIGGQIDLASEAPAGVRAYISGGKLRALGVTGDKRTPLLADVPTTAEQGFSGIRIQHWGGIYAPKGTPPAILDRIAKALATAAQSDPDMRARYEATGNELLVGTRTDFEQFAQAEKKRLGKIVVDSKMSLD
jgi:tripartite-type tricarboxylate transporter receptor subunit TctC